jgi:transposase
MPAAVPSGVKVRKGQVVAVVMIGVDPHKGSHTAVALGADEVPVGQVRVRAPPPRRSGCWAQTWPERTWAVEGAGGLGHLLAQEPGLERFVDARSQRTYRGVREMGRAGAADRDV